MHARLRLLVTWLILAALPLQALAAASMLLCQPAEAALADRVGQSAPDTHHAAHPDADHAVHAASHSVDGASLHVGDPQACDNMHADHQCSICSLCGHAMALVAATAAPHARQVPHVPLVGLTPRIDSLGHPVPDKPPRA